MKVCHPYAWFEKKIGMNFNQKAQKLSCTQWRETIFQSETGLCIFVYVCDKEQIQKVEKRNLICGLSHKLLGRHLPDGRYSDDPSDITIIEVRPCLVTQLL